MQSINERKRLTSDGGGGTTHGTVTGSWSGSRGGSTTGVDTWAGSDEGGLVTTVQVPGLEVGVDGVSLGEGGGQGRYDRTRRDEIGLEADGVDLRLTSSVHSDDFVSYEVGTKDQRQDKQSQGKTHPETRSEGIVKSHFKVLEIFSPAHDPPTKPSSAILNQSREAASTPSHEAPPQLAIHSMIGPRKSQYNQVDLLNLHTFVRLGPGVPYSTNT